ncbi:menaquinone biosynthesis protein [Paenibacillus sp. YYML68]|uniref:menaquinone biosynthesis protein n=1 Tax=Paenibacillus sp. YYML68 TaxID=2909250 RepID=UPI002492CEED|nr:menaquinone biosynthesis protein [Paenibacillus sp. YYML68]
MTTSIRPIRIGRIDFTNVWPLFYYFPFAAFGSQVEVLQQVPTGLNRAMAAGQIDIGPISSYAYGENVSEYMLFPDISVSAYGAVHSILLFHRKPLEALGGATIALPTTSATSVNLLKIILAKFYRVQPEYVYETPNLDTMMTKADAALLIGDHAIRANWEDRGYMITDLGAEWNKWTGHWMSFAVCAIRKAVIEEQPELIKRIYDGFIESKRKSLTDMTLLIEDAQVELGGEAAYWQSYFSKLSYDFGPQQWAGLKQYFEYAAELDFLKHEVPLHIWNDNSVAQVTE